MAEQTKGTGPGLAGFFRDLVRSFLPASYPKLAGRPASSSAAYLAGVLFLVTLVLTPLFHLENARALAAQREGVEKVVPDALYFEGGKASYEGEQPYIHVETIDGVRHVLMIDTTGQTTTLPEDYKFGTLITRDKIIDVKRPADEPPTVTENPVPATEGRVSARQFFLDAQEKNKWPQFLHGLGFIFIVGLLALFAIAGIATAVSFGTELLRKEDRLSGGTCFGIASHAATPVAFMTAGAWLAPTRVWAYCLVGVPFLLFGLLLISGTQACRVASRAKAEAEQTKPKKRKGK